MVEQAILKLVKQKNSFVEEVELINQINSQLPVSAPFDPDERERWIFHHTNTLVFLCRRKINIHISKKSRSVSIYPHVEALCDRFLCKPLNVETAAALVNVYSNVREEFIAEPDARKFCCCSLALNWLRTCDGVLDEQDIINTTAKFLIHNLCDVWSEIRTAYVKFLQLLSLTGNSLLSERVLEMSIEILESSQSDWQAVDGCLMAICAIIENVHSKYHDKHHGKLREKVFAVIYSQVDHCQILVRESAIRALTVFLVSGESDFMAECLESLYAKLQGKDVSPEMIEGYIAAAIEILKLVDVAIADRLCIGWNAIILKYAAHSATTVRSSAGNLAKTLVGKHVHSPKYLLDLLNALLTDIDEVSMSWREIEGRLICIDSVLRIIIANQWLYNFTSTSTKSQLGGSLPVAVRDDHYGTIYTKSSLEANADIAAEFVQLSKTQRKYAKYKRGTFQETRKPSVSFEISENIRPISLLDLCILNKLNEVHETQTLSSLLKKALYIAAKRLDANEWELRRMATQALPYIGEAIRWFDIDLFWECIRGLLNGEPDNGRSPLEMAATLLLQAWLVQSDRIYIQIEEGRLLPSSRLKEYIVATQGIFDFADILISYCTSNSNILDRQSVTSCRVLLQFLARTSWVNRGNSSSGPDLSLLLHTLISVGVSIIWSVADKQLLVDKSVKLATSLGVGDFFEVTLPKKTYLMFGSSQLHTSVGRDAVAVNEMNAKIAAIENILPEIIALLRRFIENQISEDSNKLRTANEPKGNIFTLIGSLLSPLATMVIKFTGDSDLLPYITDSMTVATTALFNCEEDTLYETVVHCISSFLEQLHLNISHALDSNSLTEKHRSMNVGSASRLAFWGCRLVLRHADDPLMAESVEVVTALCKIVAIVSDKILHLVPKEESKEQYDSLKVEGKAWNVVGTGEILQPTPDAIFSETETLNVNLPNVDKGNSEVYHSNDGESSDDADAFDDSSDEDIGYEMMSLDEDLDEQLIEMVTEMRGVFTTKTIHDSISACNGQITEELLKYLLL